MSSTEEEKPAKKKQRMMDLLRRPPTLQTRTFLEPLPHDIVFTQILSWSAGLLDLRDLLTLSMVSRSFYYTMDHKYWDAILNSRELIHMRHGVTYSKLKPRRRVAYVVALRMCRHCRRICNRNIAALRLQRGSFKVCGRCGELPEYKEVTYTEVMEMYSLKRKQLDTIPSRIQSLRGGHRRHFLLKDVLELAVQVNAPVKAGYKLDNSP
ncbi:hypothetical protein AC1031_008438 [Aphanomyces cochlioides]|nr:hypothetical protein AC1031_008438 [Aphanomyces cochlioides]